MVAERLAELKPTGTRRVGAMAHEMSSETARRKTDFDNQLSLDGRIAVVTGGGSGVGRAMAELFAERGALVVVVDVVPERVSEVTREIEGSGRKVSGLVCDLAEKPEAERMISEVMGSQGRVDILCNNAGIMDRVKPVAETDDILWQRVLAINLDAPFRASRKAIPSMLKNGGGVILNTASVAGIRGGRAGAAYTVSKHGLIGLTKSIAASYGGKGIRCNAMVLGGVETNIGLGGEPSELGMEILNKSLGMLPRMVAPAEIANLALFLVAEASGFVNGSCIVIDGGWTVF